MFAYIWSWASLKSLEVSVERRSLRVRVGDEIEERLTVRNHGLFPKPTLEVHDLTDMPGYGAGAAISLSTKSFRSWRTRDIARKRGAYTFGPVQVSTTDPFGLFTRQNNYCDTETVVVYPRTFDVPRFTIPAAYLSGDSSTRKRSHDLTPHASSVREYAYGDSISRVHWPSTARLGKLMSKDFDLGLASDVWIVVDLHRDVQAGELDESTDEYAVSIAASLAKRYIDSGMPVGLVAHGNARYFLPADTGASQFDRIMEYLAMSVADGRVSLESVLAREEQLWGSQSSLIIITPSHRTEWATAVRELTRRRIRLAAVLLDGTTFGGFLDTLDVVPHLYDAGVPPHVVSKGDDIAIALGQTYVLPNETDDAERTEVAL